MLESVKQQIERARQDYPDMQVIEQADGSIQIVINELPLPASWGRDRVSVLFTLPVGYPQVMPGGFQAKLDGQNWSGQCYRPQSWNASRDNVWKWIKLIERFFEEYKP